MTAKLGFSLASLNTYEWPVDVQVPSNGDFVSHRFTGVFKHLSHNDAKTMLERMNAKVAEIKAQEASDNSAPLDAATLIADHQIELYSDILVGWKDDLSDETGKPLPCTEHNKCLLLGQRIIRDAVIKAHRDSQAGEVVRTKNSETSPGAGQAIGES